MAKNSEFQSGKTILQLESQLRTQLANCPSKTTQCMTIFQSLQELKEWNPSTSHYIDFVLNQLHSHVFYSVLTVENNKEHNISYSEYMDRQEKPDMFKIAHLEQLVALQKQLIDKQLINQ